jgi:hypothetical protein
MKRLLLALLFAIGAIGADAPNTKGPRQSFEITTKERVDLLPGGAIRVENSYGYLTVEGWDEPEVEIVVTKSTDHFLEPEQKGQAEKAFTQIRVTARKKSDKELSISTTLPDRHGFPYSILPSRQIMFTMPKKTTLGVTVDCTVHVPRDSQLVVHQDHGYVWVSDVAGDIDVASHTGDMIVLLPDPGPYSIDARTRLGSVSSDSPGSGHKQFLVGTQFVYSGQASAHRVRLRMGCGSITIKNGPASGPYWKN